MNDSITCITIDECKHLLDSECPEGEDPFFYASLAINGLLLLTTGASELMAASKCKANSLLELIIHTVRGEQCKKPEDPLDIEMEDQV